ncbi:MAG: hypothetical protein U9Q76_01300, partial [candidate division WOR-3 bacterium]|nr:hypothetical protein [candidate division WOR-3 bacterium]
MKLIRFVLSVSVFCGVVLGGVWSKPEKIADNAGSLLAIDNQGVCWCGGSAWIYKYHSETSDWQFETKALFGGRPFFDKGDTLWVYADELDANICYVRYDGENWSEKQYVPTYPSCNWGSEITIDSTGGLWAVWTTDWWYYWKVANNRYRNGQWGQPQPVPFIDTLEEVDYGLADITTDLYGRVWIVTGKTTYDPRMLYLEASYYNGESWSGIMTIDIYEGWRASGTNLTPDEQGGMWVLFNHHGEQGGKITVLAKYWDGQTWSSADMIAVSENFYNDWPSGGKIVIDADGNAWAVWRQALEENDKYGDIYYSVNTGSGWSEPAPVSEHPAVDRYPDIAVDGEGRVWCVWSSNREGEDEWDYSVWASYTTTSGVEEGDFCSATLLSRHFWGQRSVEFSYRFLVSARGYAEFLAFIRSLEL